MPLRPLNREQSWLMPPSLDDLLAEDHPARFVGELVDGLDRDQWHEMGIDLDGEVLGAPAYHPRAVLGVWLYGFMTGVRSSRKLEAACREQLPYLWLTGCQYPDHNTLWRFYRAHRDQMRVLMKYTVGTAVEMGLVELAVQAVDGTKMGGNASRQRTYDSASLQRLLDRTEAAIADLEAQNSGGDAPPPPRLPKGLRRAKGLRQQVRAAMKRLEGDEGMVRVNLTDADAQLMKTRQGMVAGYNAQTMVSALDPAVAKTGGVLITAADVTNSPGDYGQLVPMLEQAEEMTGERAQVTLADGGYHSGANLEAVESRAQSVVMPEGGQRQAINRPYFKDHFDYEPATDSYRCPQGQRLPFMSVREKDTKGKGPYRIYRGSGSVCRACPAFGQCTGDAHGGRVLWIGPHDALLRQHRRWMDTQEAQALYARRKEMNEPGFGILKEQMGARRLLLRGLANVRSEFRLLATAFNLRTLWKVWARSQRRPTPLVGQPLAVPL